MDTLISLFPRFRFFRRRPSTGLLPSSLLAIVCLATSSAIAAETDTKNTPEQIVCQVQALWDSGATAAALEALTQGQRTAPDSLPLMTLRGDILSTTRNPAEAIQAYDLALRRAPNTVALHWAKWSVLLRWGKTDEALAELAAIARVDADNPLASLRLAQELRKADRLEEALTAYQHALTLRPDLASWRLAMARTKFDLLDYPGADREVDTVLHQIPPRSPLELPAKNLQSLIQGSSMERGRRFQHHLSPEASEQQLREWAAIRADAWQFFETGQYERAEPLYRRLLALNAGDPIATHQLGLTLMQLGRCRDALTVFGRVSNLNPSDEDYADTVFRMGQCLVELEQWEDALVHFQILYDAAVEFEEANRSTPLPGGLRVLDTSKIERWLAKVRPHVPGWESLKDQAVHRPTPTASDISDEQAAAQAVQQVPPQTALETHAALAGRDADFSWFRFVIPASKVLRDDLPTGAHEFLPLFPNDSFPRTQRDIFLVFSLVSASYDAMALTAQCIQEPASLTGGQSIATQDQVLTAMNDQSGYFQLTPPNGGWTPGLYHCSLFAGDRASAYTQVDEVRFRILDE